MYPRITSELLADPSVCAEHILGTNGPGYMLGKWSYQETLRSSNLRFPQRRNWRFKPFVALRRVQDLVRYVSTNISVCIFKVGPSENIREVWELHVTKRWEFMNSSQEPPRLYISKLIICSPLNHFDNSELLYLVVNTSDYRVQRPLLDC